MNKGAPLDKASWTVWF